MSVLHRVYAQNLRDLRAEPPDRVAAASAGLRARLLAHAAESVPFYGSIRSKVTEAAAGHPEACANLPVTSPAQLDEEAASFVASAVPPPDIALDDNRSWTSLSTPLSGPLNLLAEVADKAQWELLARTEGIDPHSRLAALLPADSVQQGDMTSSVEPWSLDAHRGRAWRWPNHLPDEATLAWLRDVGPSCLFTDGATLQRLLSAGAADLRIREVVLWTPARGSWTADVCRDVLGARLVEAIASRVAGFVASGDGTGSFRPASETVVVEIVDESGRDCPPGVPGRLLATALYGYRRPVIRCELGLSASWLAAEPGAERRFTLVREADRG